MTQLAVGRKTGSDSYTQHPRLLQRVLDGVFEMFTVYLAILPDRFK